MMNDIHARLPHPIVRAAILLTSPLLPFSALAQICDGLPGFPDATVTTVEVRDRMMCELGITFPVLPPRSSDPNRPVNAFPRDPANPEGNWTDPLGHTVVRTSFGLWHTYDSDAGVAGGAMSGFGDYGPFSEPRYTDIDLLEMQSGAAVDTPEDWWIHRRPEIFHLVQQQLYGKPIDAGIPIKWSVSAETSGVQTVGAATYPYRQKTFTGTVDTSGYPQLRNTPVITGECRYPAATGRLYLGRAALSSNGALRPVRWTGYDQHANTYQGEVDEKEAVRDAFLKEMKKGPGDLDSEYPEMRLVWQTILKAAAKTAGLAQDNARPPPEW